VNASSCVVAVHGYPQQGDTQLGTRPARPQRAALAAGDHGNGPKDCCLLADIARAAGGQRGRRFATEGLGRGTELKETSR